MRLWDRKGIVQKLKEIERKENIVVVYACELGSRAVGTASVHSDYDVRFLYLRPVEWYLSVMEKKDVLVYPLEGQEDMSGWDMIKALRLVQKSNPTLLECLNSPIRYIEHGAILEQLRRLAGMLFSPKACIHHYVKMAARNDRQAWEQDRVQVKRLTQVLRPVLACGWIERFGDMPPVPLRALTETLLGGEDIVRAEALELLEAKRAGSRTLPAVRMQSLRHYLTEQIGHYEHTIREYRAAPGGMESEVDALFRAALKEIWSLEGWT